RAGLTEVVVLRVEFGGGPHHVTRDGPGQVLTELFVGDRPAEGVRRVDRLVPGVVVTHRTVEGVGVYRYLRLVDRELVVVRADPVAVGVGVGEHAAQQHLVWGDADTRNQVGGLERRLLDLG